MAMKKWEELDVLDNYLINAVASDPEVAEPFFRRLLSVLLQRKVGKIRVETEKFIPGVIPDKRGIRLDVEVDEYLSDGTDEPAVANVYDIEPHLQDDSNFPKLMRFRQARLDSRHMKSGDKDYSHMPDLYVILITNFDVFDKDCMIYTFRHICKEEPDIEYNDGLTILYFNTNGTKGGSRDIENMLKYLQDSREVMAVDEATKELDGYIESVKENASLKGDYMDFGDLIDNYVEREVKIGVERGIQEKLEEAVANKIEEMTEQITQQVTEQVTKDVTEQVTLSTLHDVILGLLADKGDIPDKLRNKINAVTDPEYLRVLYPLAAHSQSIDEFVQKMK